LVDSRDPQLFFLGIPGPGNWLRWWIPPRNFKVISSWGIPKAWKFLKASGFWFKPTFPTQGSSGKAQIQGTQGGKGKQTRTGRKKEFCFLVGYRVPRCLRVTVPRGHVDTVTWTRSRFYSRARSGLVT